MVKDPDDKPSEKDSKKKIMWLEKGKKTPKFIHNGLLYFMTVRLPNKRNSVKSINVPPEVKVQ